MSLDPGPGTIKVKLLDGRLHLSSVSALKTYLVLELNDNQFTTDVVVGQAPIWNQEFDLLRDSEGVLELKLFSKGLFSSKLKGAGVIMLKRVLLDCRERAYHRLFHNGLEVGEVLTELLYQPSLRPSPQPPSYKTSLIEVPVPPKEGSPKSPPALELTTRDLIFEDELYRSPNGKQLIYNARILPSNTPAAVKITYCTSQDEYNEIQSEGITMCMVSHPNICKVYANLFDNTHGTLNNLIVMEKIEGGDLAVHIKERAAQHKPWPELELSAHFNALLSAFSELEAKGVVHSDIKPQNVVLTSLNHLKVIDFGISLVNTSEFFATAKTLDVGGTIPYFSPLQLSAYIEFVSGRNPSGKVKHNPCKSDVFALGLTFYHMASLQLPTGLNDNAAALQSRIDAAVAALEYSEAVKSVIRRMLVADERARPTFTQLSK